MAAESEWAKDDHSLTEACQSSSGMTRRYSRRPTRSAALAVASGGQRSSPVRIPGGAPPLDSPAGGFRMRGSRPRERVMDIATVPRRAGGAVRFGTGAARLSALALAVVIAGAGAAQAGGRHHHRYDSGDLAVWFAFGSMLTLLTVAHTHPAPVVHPHHHRPHHRAAPRHSHRGYRHAHGSRWHSHGLHHRHPGHFRETRRLHHADRAHHGPGHAHHGHRHRRVAPPRWVLSHRHRHGSGAWHVHPLERPRAHHRH